MNLNQAIIQRVGNNKYPTLKRIKLGKTIGFLAALPLGTSWMFAISVPMCMPMSLTLWAKMKMIDFREWRKLG